MKLLAVHTTVASIDAARRMARAEVGEAEARLTLGENVAEDAPIRVGLLRALWFVAPGWRIGGGAAYGTRLFDVIAVEHRDTALAMLRPEVLQDPAARPL